jgi:hypothetical protein
MTDPGKASKKGRQAVVLREGHITTVREDELYFDEHNLLEDVYVDGKLVREQDFADTIKIDAGSLSTSCGLSSGYKYQWVRARGLHRGPERELRSSVKALFSARWVAWAFRMSRACAEAKAAARAGGPEGVAVTPVMVPAIMTMMIVSLGLRRSDK